MRLSNRSAQSGVSAQLAEIGFEQALSSLNNNSWTGWTTTGKVASRTLSFASNKYGASGATPTVNIQITNRYASSWVASASYAAGDVAWFKGKWYQCTTATGPTNASPNIATGQWTSTPGAWDSNISYATGDIVSYDGQVYRSLLPHTSMYPTDTTTWTSQSTLSWSASTNYVAGNTVLFGGTIYKCIAAHINSVPPNTNYWAGAPVIYSQGVATLADGTPPIKSQIRAEFMPATLFPNAVGATNSTSSIQFASTGTIESYNSNLLQLRAWDASTTYLVGDTVYYGTNGNVYQCITGHSSQNPTDTNYWIPASYSYRSWNASDTYQVGELVTQSGTVYRCIASNTNQSPPNATYWVTQSLGYATWASGTNYTVGTVVFYQPPAVDSRNSSGMIYRCRTAHTSSGSSTPTNTTNWETGTVGYATWTSGTGFRPGDITFYPATGFWYRCKTTHTNQPPVASGTVDSTNWEHLKTDFAVWSNAVAYKVGDLVYRSSNGTVYRCILDHTNQAPPNSTFWSNTAFGYSAVVAAPAVTSSSSAIIRGFVNTANSTGLGTNTYVVGPTSPASPRIDPTRVSSSYFVPFFDLPASYTALSSSGSNLPASEGNGTILYPGARTLGTPGATSPSIYNITGTYVQGSAPSYYAGLVRLNSTDTLTIVGPVILNVLGYFYAASGRIIIAPTGSLEVYYDNNNTTSNFLYLVSSANTGGGILNQTFDPRKLLIVSPSTNNTSSIHRHGQWHPFHGLTYMPNAYLHKTNSGYNSEIYGAFSAKTVYFNNAANLDYDMALRTAGSIGTYLDRPFQLSTWRELTDGAEKISLP